MTGYTNYMDDRSWVKATRFFRLITVVLICLGMVVFPPQQALARPAYAPTPSASVSVPASPFIGDTLSISATFSNTGNTGYGPFMDLFLPLSGKDGTNLPGGTPDGISFLSANYLGAAVTTNVLNCPAGSTVTHPLTGLPLTCPAQPAGLFSPFVWQLVVITMPFGSFVPGQPDATISINAQLSNYADLNVGLPIQVRSGFMFGADSLDNPSTDPVIQSEIAAIIPVPSPNLITLTKTYNGPENETATGPNYPREYTVTATIAAGQTVTNLTLTDVLPNNMQFLTMVNPSNASCTTLPITSTPGGSITCPVTQVGNTASMTFRFFIPLDDNTIAPVINAVSGNDVLSQNTASATGSWQPLDSRDPLTPITVDPVGYEHTLTDKSIAIQKSVSNITDRTNSPGDVLEYTLTFQISDYFSFESIVSTDSISDGQHFDSSFTPLLTVTEHGSTSVAAVFDGANFTVDTSQIGNTGVSGDGTDGSTKITFRISDELISRSLDGKLIGGCVPGTGGIADCDAQNPGATTGTITFRTIIQEDFTDTYPSGDSSVDQGDDLGNTVLIDGNVLYNTTLLANGSSEEDGSSASVSIPYGVITKSIYAINQNTTFASPVSVSPGDTVTYRVTYTLPTSDFEALVLSDYLPLPVFDATTVTTFKSSVCGIPANGVSCYGDTDTYHLLVNTPAPVVPIMTSSSALNNVSWTYGDYDAENNLPSKIDILFTATVNNLPFADGLYLTNQAHVQENNHADDAIAQILLQEPLVNIKKGVIWTDKFGAIFTPSTVGPVTFSGSGCPAFSGTVNSTNLTTNPINSNLAGVDAGDTIKMALVVENTGRNAGYDLLVKDSLPAGLTFVDGSVCVTDGAGTALAFTGTANDLTSSGITLTSLARGKLSDGTTVATGTNIAIITYNVTVDATSEASHLYTNTATLTSYAGQPGGPNHIPGGRTDTATTTVTPMAVSKNITSTNQTFTTGNNVAIGEIIKYTIDVTIPEGTTQNVVVNDTLPTGMAFVDCLSITPDSGVTTNLTGGFSAACNDPTNPTVTGNGVPVGFTLGTLTNSNNTTAAEKVRIIFTAVILNQGTLGTTRTNAVSLSYTSNGGTTTLNANSPAVTIVEPTLRVNKTVSPTTGDAGDPVTYTISIQHSASSPISNADAFNAHVKDDLSALPLTFGTLSAVTFTGATCGTPTVTNASAGSIVDLTFSTLPLGCVASFTYNATITAGASAGQAITNTANIDWSSLPGTVSDQSPYNDILDCERTGNTADCGGAANNYSHSDPATVTVPVTSTKSLVSTSEAHTASDRLVIGEIARYRLQMVWPEGATTNAMFRDNLPNYMQFLNDGTAKVAFVSDNGVDCSASPAATMTSSTLGTSPWQCGNATTIASITPTYVLPDAGVSSSATSNLDSYVSGTDPHFKFGDLTNSDRDSDATHGLEYVVVEFNALVLNNTNNQSGSSRGNTFILMVGATPATVGSNSNTVTIYVAEPSLSISKSIIAPAPVDAGDPITYQMVITNNSAAPNGTTAFDLVMSDTLNINLNNIAASVFGTTQTTPCTGGTAFSAPVPSVVGQVVTFNASCLDIGKTITVRITANVSNTASSSLTIPNSAQVTYTSLPGNTGTPGASNSTGSTTPGATGTGTGERNGSGGAGSLNDYTTLASISTSLANPVSVVKNAPTPTTYTIGQTITYPIVVTLHEGTTQSLRVTDTLPQGLEYLSFSVVTTGFNGTVTTIPTVGTIGNPVTNPSTTTFTFGNITVNATASSGTSSFTINVTARVLDITQNQIGDTKSNSATLIYVDPDTSSDVSMDGGSQTITIVEPRIETTKSVSPTEGVKPGNILTYTVRFTNTGTSTAYEVTALDVLAQGVTYNDGSIACVDNASAVVSVSLSNNTSTLGFDGSPAGSWDIPVNGYIQCTYTATAGSKIYLDGNHTNTIDADWTGLDGADLYERTYDDTVTRIVDGTQDTDDAVFNNTGITFDKTVDKSSATIGEVITYTLTITGPTGLLHDLSITDTLDAGLIFNNDTVVSGLSVTPTPTYGLNDGSAPVMITWNFGDVEKSTETATLTYSVTVADETATTTGDTLGNSASLTYKRADESAAGPLTDTTTTGIVEPNLNLIKSIVTPPSGTGTTVTYSLLLSHTGTSTSDAYDVVILDTVPTTYLDFTTTDNSALTVTFTPVACSSAINNSNPATDTVSISIAHLPLGCQAEVKFTATLKEGITSGLLVTNNASTTYSTLSGTPVEERDYTDSDSVTFNGPTAVLISSFEVTADRDGGLIISWETTVEIDLLNFNVYRSVAPDGYYSRINPNDILAQAPGSNMGSTYLLKDSTAAPGVPSYYKLEAIEVSGVHTFFGPISGIPVSNWYFMPFVVTHRTAP